MTANPSLKHTLALSALALVLAGCAVPKQEGIPPAPVAARDQRPANLQPTRIAPATMQAWIAPWEDATGDLYPAASIYIEVVAEQWQYSGNGMPVLRPLQIEQPAPDINPNPAGSALPFGAPALAPVDGAMPRPSHEA